MEVKMFKVTMPVFKSYIDEDGNLYIKGLGGDTESDYDPKVKRIERLSLACIQDMKSQIEAGKVILVPKHWDVGPKDVSNVNRNDESVEWDQKLGSVVAAEITPTGQLFPEIKLDKLNPQAIFLFKKIHEEGKEFGLSWGGWPLAWHTEFTLDGKEIRVFDKIELWHFAVTTRPVNSRTLSFPLQAIAKSLDWITADRIETSAFADVDYPDRDAVQAIFKSLEGGGGNIESVSDDKKPDAEPVVKTNSQEVMQMLDAEAIKAITEIVSAAVAPLRESLKSQTAEKETALKAAADQKKIDDAIAAALKAHGIDPAADKKPAAEEKIDVAALKTELLDSLKQEINKSLESVTAGLKSGLNADNNKPGEKEKESEVLKAFGQLQRKEKCLADFPADVRRKLEDLSAAAGEAVLKSMPGGRV